MVPIPLFELKEWECFQCHPKTQNNQNETFVIQKSLEILTNLSWVK